MLEKTEQAVVEFDALISQPKRIAQLAGFGRKKTAAKLVANIESQLLKTGTQLKQAASDLDVQNEQIKTLNIHVDQPTVLKTYLALRKTLYSQKAIFKNK